jgi:Family of unknown function (DUF6636)
VLAAVVALALALHAAPTPAKLVHFKSPSGNINCIGAAADKFQPAFVDCIVRKNTWPNLRPKPANCDLDWVAGELSVSKRRVFVGGCRGDIGPLCIDPANPCRTLAYGRFVDLGPLRCVSAAVGITCRYRIAPRAGFRIAREGYSLYR